MKRRSVLGLGVLGAALLLSAATLACSALAAGPSWQFTALSNTTVPPGGTLTYRIVVRNMGDASSSGPVKIEATLPSGMKATGVQPTGFIYDQWDCSATLFPASKVTCTDSAHALTPFGSGESEGSRLMLVATAGANQQAGAVKTATFEVSGGGAPAAATAAPVTISPTPPPFGLAALDGSNTDRHGAVETRAGGHPFGASVSFELNTEHSSIPIQGDLWPVEPLRESVTELPAGFVGSPVSAPRCPGAEFANPEGGAILPLCDPASQVGSVDVRFRSDAFPDTYGPVPLYSLVPPPGVPARFGFAIVGVVVVLDAHVRSSGDYGVDVISRNISEGIPLAGFEISLWGDPASPVHDFERACPGREAPVSGGPVCAGAESETPFLRSPTSCGGPEAMRTTMLASSWAHTGAYTPAGEPDLTDPNWKASSFLQHQAPGYPYPASQWGPPVQMEGCNEIPFTPRITLRPTTDRADSPTGLDFDLTMPQGCWEAGESESICQADVKDSSVSQPVGMRVNPATADGLVGCSEEQIGFIGGGFPMPNPTHFTSAQPTCPNASKIGTVEIDSPLIPDTLEGAIYQAKQNENPFGSTLGFYAVADADGVMIKLPAEVVTDPNTGQVTTIFRDSPQLPFEHYKLHFFGGPRAPLITPPTCGTYTTHSSFSGWANPEEAAHPEDSFQITEGPNGTPCARSEGERPFSPSFEAGTTNPLAGAFSSFVLKIGREDGTQELSGLETTLPEGLLGKLAGIPYCPDAAIEAAEHARALAEREAASCPPASQVGIADASAGAGPDPFHNPGKVYLAGPYKGAPLSLVIVTPALAGPLDLGTVVVRAALRVDPETAQIHVASDPIPSMITEGGDGFPLDLRRIVVQMNRPEFTLNPTSCDPTSVDGTVTALQGATASVSSRFQVGNCERLAFKPKLRIALKGQVERSGHPGVRATLTMPSSGQANIARTTVSLPHSEFLAQGHLQNVCTRVQYAERGGGGERCPLSSIYGHAIAFSPLLAEPLQGNVYLRSNGGERLLPDLVASLNGQIHVDLVGYVGTNKKTEGLRTSFATVPDAPVSKFVLTLPPGKHSLLENSTNICRGTHRALIQMDAHSGKIADSQVKLRVKGCGKSAKGRRRHHR